MIKEHSFLLESQLVSASTTLRTAQAVLHAHASHKRSLCTTDPRSSYQNSLQTLAPKLSHACRSCCSNWCSMSQLLLPAPRLQGLAQHDTRRSWQCRQLWGQRPSLERAEGCRWRARPAGSAAGGVVASAAGFHQSRMVATERSSEPVQRLQLSVRCGWGGRCSLVEVCAVTHAR